MFCPPAISGGKAISKLLQPCESGSEVGMESVGEQSLLSQ